MQLTISVSQFGGILLVQISIFRPKNTRTKAYLSISLGGQNPRGGTLSASRIMSGETISASGYCPGGHFLLGTLSAVTPVWVL